MTWPWTSRGRLDDALAQVAELRQQVTHLQDALVRISRHDAGLTEEPRAPRPAPKPMPPALLEYLNHYGSPSVRKTARDAAFKRYQAGESWESIQRDLAPPEPVEAGSTEEQP